MLLALRACRRGPLAGPGLGHHTEGASRSVPASCFLILILEGF